MLVAPVNANIGDDALKGNETPNVILKIERNSPSGNHMNMTSEDVIVGMKANLPSWKINGLGNNFFGNARQFLLSSELNIKQTFCKNRETRSQKVLFLDKKKHEVCLNLK